MADVSPTSGSYTPPPARTNTEESRESERKEAKDSEVERSEAERSEPGPGVGERVDIDA